MRETDLAGVIVQRPDRSQVHAQILDDAPDTGAGEPLATMLLWRPWQFEREWIAWLASVNLLLPVLILPGLWVLWRRGGR